MVKLKHQEIVMGIKSLISIYFERSKPLPQDLHFYLKPKKVIQGAVLVEKNDMKEEWPIEKLEKEIEIEYLPNLVFDKEESLKHVLAICKNANKEGYVEGQMVWWGIYYKELLQKHALGPVYLKYIDPVLEWGLFAKADIKANTFIGEYTGIVTKYRHFKHRTNGYCFEYSIGQEKTTPYTIDAQNKGNLTRFINHSYKPNVNQIAVYYDQMMHIVFKTNRFVAKGEQLTYDYGYYYWEKREKPL